MGQVLHGSATTTEAVRRYNIVKRASRTRPIIEGAFFAEIGKRRPDN